MAYKIEIKQFCDESYCTKRATFIVRAYANEDHGRYCAKHADERVRDLTKAEASNPAGFGL